MLLFQFLSRQETEEPSFATRGRQGLVVSTFYSVYFLLESRQEMEELNDTPGSTNLCLSGLGANHGMITFMST